jgi:hypothetical protein
VDFAWAGLLARWSDAVLSDPEAVKWLPPEAVQAGWL